MKKRSLLSFLIVALISSAMVFTTSCGEDDTEAPVITLNESDDYTVYGVAYEDPGATATDNDDKNPEVSASGVIDENIAGEQPIVYTATDKDGNTSTKTRTVTVDAAPYTVNAAGSANFGVNDTDPDVPDYTDNVTVSSAAYNRIYFAKFAWYDNAAVYAELAGANGLTIPEQVVNCGNDNVDRKFTGTGTFTNNALTVSYTVALADGTGEFSGTATYTKQ